MSDEITREDLVAYLSGKCDDHALRARIAQESERNGSPVQRWLTEMGRRAADPFGLIDWLRIAGFGGEEDSSQDGAQPAAAIKPSTAVPGPQAGRSQAPSMPPPFLAIALGEPEDTSEAVQFTPRRIEVPSDQCHWVPRRPELLDSPTATIEMRWLPTQVLTLTFGGFFRVGKAYRLEVAWLDAGGISRTENDLNTPVSRFMPVIELRPTDGVPPRRGDRLIVREFYEPPEEDGWEVHIELVLS